MQTLDHPPLLDFYRNSNDEEGVAVNRPSMLELLHGGKNKEFDEFEVFCYFLEWLCIYVSRSRTSVLLINKLNKKMH